MSISKSYFFALLSLLAITQVNGQATKTPFSTFGIGEQYGNALVNNQGMGGVSVSQPQFWYANSQNPALLVYNNLTVFQVGVVGERRTLRAADAREKNTGGNLNYLTTAFPIKPTKWSTSISLSPYTSVNYRLSYTEPVINGTDSINVIESGEGGVTQLSWSNGVRLTREIAIGLRASYLFGSILNTYQGQLKTSQQPINYPAAIEERSYVKDFAFSAGFSFSRDSLFSRQKYRLSFGAVYDFATDLSTRQRTTIYRVSNVDDRADEDTLSTHKGYISMPGAITAGVSLSRGGKWTIGTEVSYRDWTNFKSVNKDDEGLKSAWRVSLGGEITPDAFASENYLKRITYRVGGSIEEYPYLANNNSVKDIGINFGFSLPTGRSSLDFAFKYGKRGNRKENIFEEDYFRVYFGITFNDQWFIRRKFD
ncbi:hypothetical protein [Chryseosolibacter indicus]|uniref:Long-chain fatty acid transport protein n=1 Tax=Chryseosolibacter indicus TaxID=2782351 RepID=A0ABS5VTB2_9BACT|nr:hypothetical protein [Chryseosolibacter indicus]MBT1704658.1 hypothetical protein [Chryseosolibacter indicus]